MKRAMVAMTLVAVAAMAGAAEWQHEPTGYKDIPWGTTLEEWKLLPLGKEAMAKGIPGLKPGLGACTPAGNEASQAALPGATGRCQSRWEVSVPGRVGPAIVVKEEWYFDSAAKLALVRWDFNADEFVSIEKLLVARFGEPHAVESKQVQNAFGASFTDQTLTWSGTKARVYARKYPSDLRRSMVEMGQESVWLARKAAAEAAQAKLKQDATKF